MNPDQVKLLFEVLSRIEIKIDNLSNRLSKIESSAEKMESNLDDIVEEQVRLTDYCEVSGDQVKFFQNAYENVREPLGFVFTQLNTFKETFKYLTANQTTKLILPAIPSHKSHIVPPGASRRIRQTEKSDDSS